MQVDIWQMNIKDLRQGKINETYLENTGSGIQTQILPF